MLIYFIRHATLTIMSNGITLLVDPMLSLAEAMEPVGNAANTRRIPMVELPLDELDLQNTLRELDAVLVTHTHRDHWDARAVELLRKDIQLFCQPGDENLFKEQGFTHVQPIEESFEWEGIEFIRTGGQHGTGEIGQKMGKVSGFVLGFTNEPTLYLAGDTVWCPEVEQALAQHKPEIIVVNAGAAQFLVGDPITMTAEDVMRVCEASSGVVIPVHMDTINHCLLTRADLAAAIEQSPYKSRVLIPDDGMSIQF